MEVGGYQKWVGPVQDEGCVSPRWLGAGCHFNRTSYKRVTLATLVMIASLHDFNALALGQWCFPVSWGCFCLKLSN